MASTPVRAALDEKSALHSNVRDGLGAVAKEHHGKLHQDVRAHFGDSLDLDEAIRPGHDQEHRWDYLLGHTPSNKIVAVEPHSAESHEVKVVIAKRKAALEQLRPHLRNGARVAAWIWVASGRNQFTDTEKARRLLDQSGIEFVCPTVLAKHLPAAAPPPAVRQGRGRRR